MSDFLAKAVDKHTDAMPKNKRILALATVVLIYLAYYYGSK